MVEWTKFDVYVDVAIDNMYSKNGFVIINIFTTYLVFIFQVKIVLFLDFW